MFIKISVDEMKEMRGVVRSLSAPPLHEPAPAPQDKFEAFAQSVATFLRDMDEDDAMERMGEMSCILFRNKKSLFTL